MTVGELILLLQAHDPNCKVVTGDDYRNPYFMEGVSVTALDVVQVGKGYDYPDGPGDRSPRVPVIYGR